MSKVSKVKSAIKNVFERELGIEFLPEEKEELEEFNQALIHHENILSGYVQIIDEKTIFLRPSLLLTTKTVKCINLSSKELPPNNAKVRLTGFWKRVPYVVGNKYESNDVFFFDDWEIIPRPKVRLPLSYDEVLEFFIEDMGIDFKDPYLSNRFLYQDALLTNSISSPPLPRRLVGGIYSSVSYLNSYKTKAQRALARIKRMIPSTSIKIGMGMRNIELKYFILKDAKNQREQKKFVSQRKKMVLNEPFIELSANFHLSEARVEKFVKKKFYGDLSFLLPTTLEVRKELPVLEQTRFEVKSILSGKRRLPPNIHIPLFFIAVHLNMPTIDEKLILKSEQKISKFYENHILELDSAIVGKDKLIDPNRLYEQALRLGLYFGRRKESDRITISEIDAGISQLFALSDKFIEELSIHEKTGQPRLSSIQASIIKVYEKLENKNEPVSVKLIIKELEGKINAERIKIEIEKMINNGIFYMPKPGFVKIP